MRNILFVGEADHNDWCSMWFFRGYYVADQLKSKYQNVEYKHTSYLLENINNITNTIIIAIGYCLEYKIVSTLKQNNNIVITDVLDRYEPNYPYLDNFDYVIVNSNYMKTTLEHLLKNTKIIVIYHSYDPRLNPSNQRSDSVQYIGCEAKKTFQDMKYYTHSYGPFLIRNSEYNTYPTIQITFVSPNNPIYFKHTSTKLATAMGCNSIFVSNRIPVFEELLGKDYLFFCDTEEEFHQKIEQARIYMRTDEYYQYLDKLKHIKSILSPSYMINCYDNLLTEISNTNY